MYYALLPNGTGKTVLSLIRSVARTRSGCFAKFTSYLISLMLWFIIMVLSLTSQLLTKSSCFMGWLLQRHLSKSTYYVYLDPDSNFPPIGWITSQRHSV